MPCIRRPPRLAYLSIFRHRRSRRAYTQHLFHDDQRFRRAHIYLPTACRHLLEHQTRDLTHAHEEFDVAPDRSGAEIWLTGVKTASYSRHSQASSTSTSTSSKKQWWTLDGTTEWASGAGWGCMLRTALSLLGTGLGRVGGEFLFWSILSCAYAYVYSKMHTFPPPPSLLPRRTLTHLHRLTPTPPSFAAQICMPAAHTRLLSWILDASKAGGRCGDVSGEDDMEKQCEHDSDKGRRGMELLRALGASVSCPGYFSPQDPQVRSTLTAFVDLAEGTVNHVLVVAGECGWLRTHTRWVELMGKTLAARKFNTGGGGGGGEHGYATTRLEDYGTGARGAGMEAYANNAANAAVCASVGYTNASADEYDLLNEEYTEDASELEDELNEDEDEMAAALESSMKEPALGDWARGRILDGARVAPADVYYGVRVGGLDTPENPVKATHPIPWAVSPPPSPRGHVTSTTTPDLPTPLPADTTPTTHPGPPSPSPPTYALAKATHAAHMRQMHVVLLPAFRNVVRHVVVECSLEAREGGSGGPCYARRADVARGRGARGARGGGRNARVEAATERERERERRHRTEGSDDSSEGTSRTSDTSPVLSTSTLGTTPSPPPLGEHRKDKEGADAVEEARRAKEARERQPTIAVMPVLDPPRLLHRIPFVPETIAHLPMYSLEALQAVWREACAPLHHCRCTICERAMAAVFLQRTTPPADLGLRFLSHNVSGPPPLPPSPPVSGAPPILDCGAISSDLPRPRSLYLSECKISSPLGFLPHPRRTSHIQLPRPTRPPLSRTTASCALPAFSSPSPPQRPFSIHHPPAPLPVLYRDPIQSELPPKPSESSATPPLRLQSIRPAARASPAPCGGDLRGTTGIPLVDCAHIQVRRALCSAAAPVSPFRRMTRTAERSEGGERFRSMRSPWGQYCLADSLACGADNGACIRHALFLPLLGVLSTKDACQSRAHTLGAYWAGYSKTRIIPPNSPRTGFWWRLRVGTALSVVSSAHLAPWPPPTSGVVSFLFPRRLADVS
ncbi:hypothetical protein B0H11DRAFT_2252929 [Mycena galericulata]|nr:hypothetical protein B0H11DRAFT_2252929 [Mycena galericulata]